MTVRWYADPTGRFPQRPHYDPSDLDDECERVLRAFFERQSRPLPARISTDDLMTLIERDAALLDPYADLTAEGPNVEGLTVFERHAQPSVYISRELSEDGRRTNRFRSTLTHEFGHVHLHKFLFDSGPEPLFPSDASRNQPEASFLPTTARRGAEDRQVCKRETILSSATVDWMEWQAGYACGAFLMPASLVADLVADLRDPATPAILPQTTSAEGSRLIASTAGAFEVSTDAARVRLIKLQYLHAE